MMGMTMKTVDITYRYETRDTPDRPRPLDSISALGRLNNGNLAFAGLLDESTKEHVERIISVDSRDLGLGDKNFPKQRPFAAILGCSDARAPVELIFNEGPNELFVIRVAGNGLGTEILGSLKYGRLAEGMSALPPKADIAERNRQVDPVRRKVGRTTAPG